MMDVLITLIVVIMSWLYVYGQTHQIVCNKYVNNYISTKVFFFCFFLKSAGWSSSTRNSDLVGLGCGMVIRSFKSSLDDSTSLDQYPDCKDGKESPEKEVTCLLK